MFTSRPAGRPPPDHGLAVTVLADSMLATIDASPARRDQRHNRSLF